MTAKDPINADIEQMMGLPFGREPRVYSSSLADRLKAVFRHSPAHKLFTSYLDIMPGGGAEAFYYEPFHAIFLESMPENKEMLYHIEAHERTHAFASQFMRNGLPGFWKCMSMDKAHLMRHSADLMLLHYVREGLAEYVALSLLKRKFGEHGYFIDEVARKEDILRNSVQGGADNAETLAGWKRASAAIMGLYVNLNLPGAFKAGGKRLSEVHSVIKSLSYTLGYYGMETYFRGETENIGEKAVALMANMPKGFPELHELITAGQ